MYYYKLVIGKITYKHYQLLKVTKFQLFDRLGTD